jgi:hypothetical protein
VSTLGGINSSGGLGIGYQEPLHGNSEVNRTTFLHDRAMAAVRTMMPVKIIKIYKGNQYPPQTQALQGEIATAGFVDVQPVVSQVDGGGQSMQHSIIYGIPFMRMYGGTNALIMDPVKGDIGYITVGDRDVSAFWKSAVGQGQNGGLGGNTNNTTSASSAGPGTSGAGGILPASRRRFSPSDSVYVGGVLNQKPKQYVTFMSNGIQFSDSNGNVFVLSNGSASNSNTAAGFGGGSATGQQATNTNTGVKGVTITDMSGNHIWMRNNDSANYNGMLVQDLNGNKIEMRKGDSSGLNGMRITDVNNNVITTNPGGVSVTSSGTMTLNVANVFATGDVVAQWSQAGTNNVSLTNHIHQNTQPAAGQFSGTPFPSS